MISRNALLWKEWLLSEFGDGSLDCIAIGSRSAAAKTLACYMMLAAWAAASGGSIAAFPHRRADERLNWAPGQTLSICQRMRAWRWLDGDRVTGLERMRAKGLLPPADGMTSTERVRRHRLRQRLGEEAAPRRQRESGRRARAMQALEDVDLNTADLAASLAMCSQEKDMLTAWLRLAAINRKLGVASEWDAALDAEKLAAAQARGRELERLAASPETTGQPDSQQAKRTPQDKRAPQDNGRPQAKDAAAEKPGQRRGKAQASSGQTARRRADAHAPAAILITPRHDGILIQLAPASTETFHPEKTETFHTAPPETFHSPTINARAQNNIFKYDFNFKNLNNNLKCRQDKPQGPCLHTPSGRFLAGQTLRDFETFWQAFAYPKAKANAADAWLDLADEMTPQLLAKITAAARAEASAREQLEARGAIPIQAKGWLLNRRFEDYSTPEPKKNTPTEKKLDPEQIKRNWQAQAKHHAAWLIRNGRQVPPEILARASQL